jgi:hypothetical protein
MPVYLHATLRAKYGQAERLCEAVGALVPLLEAEGWKLLGAYRASIGNRSHVIDLWELPDANAFGEGLVAAAARAGFPEIAAALAEAIEEEVVQLMTKTSYSP